MERRAEASGVTWLQRRLPAVVMVSLACPAAQALVKPDLSVMLPMSDGTQLATDVYLPKRGGPAWPVRIIRTPYGRTRSGPKHGLEAANGYVMVVQDMRGRFGSQGRDFPFLGCGWGEHQDGLETIRWIQAQPWGNGKIGTEGGSAMGCTQHLVAGTSPPLAAQYIIVAPPSLYHYAVYPGGAFTAALMVGWLTDNRFHPDCAWLLAMHPFYDGHWQGFDAVARADRIDIPAVHYGGWYDVFQQGTIEGFVSRQYHGGAGARGTQKLVIGPWPHHGARDEVLGEVHFPANSRLVPFPLDRERWFGHYLKGEDNGIEKAPAVQYYTMGAVSMREKDAPGNEWHTADAWPIPAKLTRFYFHADGSLSSDLPQESDARREYDYDPSNPVPTRGGCHLTLPPGPFDQRPVENRPDVLTFTTAPLSEPMEVTGRLIAEIVLVSDRVDTDVTAKLTDVYPDGRSMLIADGIARCRYREGYERLALLKPGEPARVEVDLWSTSIVFNKGHRIRVAVSSSNYPRFDVNPNTGWPAWPMGPVLIAHNEILCSQGHSSAIILPVVKR